MHARARLELEGLSLLRLRLARRKVADALLRVRQDDQLHGHSRGQYGIKRMSREEQPREMHNYYTPSPHAVARQLHANKKHQPSMPLRHCRSGAHKASGGGAEDSPSRVAKTSRETPLSRLQRHAQLWCGEADAADEHHLRHLLDEVLYGECIDNGRG